MYDYSQDIYIELQDINDNIEAFIQQENNNNDSVVNAIDNHNYQVCIYLGTILLFISVFNLLAQLPNFVSILRKEK